MEKKEMGELFSQQEDHYSRRQEQVLVVVVLRQRPTLPLEGIGLAEVS